MVHGIFTIYCFHSEPWFGKYLFYSMRNIITYPYILQCSLMERACLSYEAFHSSSEEERSPPCVVYHLHFNVRDFRFTKQCKWYMDEFNFPKAQHERKKKCIFWYYLKDELEIIGWFQEGPLSLFRLRGIGFEKALWKRGVWWAVLSLGRYSSW